MPPVRIKERGKAKKGTMKRLLKMLFKQFPAQLIISLICLVFNVIGNLSSSIFASLTTTALVNAVKGGFDPFKDVYAVETVFGFNVNTNVFYLLVILGSIYVVGIFASLATSALTAA